MRIAERIKSLAARETREGLEERAEALKSLIRQDPGRAAEAMFTDRPAFIAQVNGEELIEHAFSYSGPVQTVVADDFEGRSSVTIYRFEQNGQMIEAYQPGHQAASATCGSEAVIEGMRVDDVVMVTRTQVVRPAADATPTPCPTTGTSRVAVLLVYMPGTPQPVVSKEDMQKYFFGSDGKTIRNYYREVSQGKADLDGQVFGWYPLDRFYACGDTGSISTAAVRAADADVDWRSFQRVYIFFSGVDPKTCSYGGLGTIGCSTIQSPKQGSVPVSVSWQHSNGPKAAWDIRAQIVIHELGHNFGLIHSSALLYPGTPLGPDDSLQDWLEYGDPFDPMGSGATDGLTTPLAYASHFSASRKRLLRWLTPEEVLDVSAPGDFTLRPANGRAAGVRALRINRNLRAGERVWLEYRTDDGRFETGRWFDGGYAGGNSSKFLGATLRYETVETGVQALFIDAAAPSLLSRTVRQDIADEPVLKPGQTWADPYSDLTITVLELTPERMTVRVRYDTPCAAVSGWPSSRLPSNARSLQLAVSAPATCTWSALGNNWWLQPQGPELSTGGRTVTFAAADTSASLVRRTAISVARQTRFVEQSGVPAKPQVIFVATRGYVMQGSTPVSRIFETSVQVPSGATELDSLEFTFNDQPTAANACAVRFDVGRRTMRLRTPDGAGFVSGEVAVGSGADLRNGICTILKPEVSQFSATQMNVSFTMGFGQSEKPLWVRAADTNGLATDWEKRWEPERAFTCQVMFYPYWTRVAPEAGSRTLESWWMPSPCAWTVTSDSPWLRVSPSSGSGSSAVMTLSWDALPASITSRVGYLTVGSTRYPISQNAAVAYFGQTEDLRGPGPGTKELVLENIPAAQAANLRAVSSASWLTITKIVTSANSRSATLTFSWAANQTGQVRVATITALGATFALRQAAAAAGAPLITEVIDAAGLQPKISPYAWVTIKGINLSATTRIWAADDFVGGRMPTELDGVKVTVGGIPVAVYYISPTQINILTPNLIYWPTPVRVTFRGVESQIFWLEADDYVAAVFTLPGGRYPAGFFTDGLFAAPIDSFAGLGSRPARPGDVLTLYATGLGGASYTDYLIPPPSPVRLRNRWDVTVGAVNARVLYQEYVSPGLVQMNIEIPAGLPAGDQPLVLRQSWSNGQSWASPPVFVPIQ